MANNSNQLAQLIDDVPKEMAPAEDLWPGIARRLDAPAASKPNQLWRPFALASLLLLALVIGKPFSTQETAVPNHDALLATLAGINTQHQQQVTELAQQATHVDWQISPYGQPVENGIKQLKDAAKQIYQNLQLNPTDKQLWQLWLWTQQREIELIKQGQNLPVIQHKAGEII
ncbi:hypothetical protein BEL05_06065 [Shewanella colwelliana]|uniref:Uncharacterized protein n=1 Tax=Shewanella colwelliana TaxID=23 RepID=A0A1E5IV50_SHECO|nr:hypothetical protein [Shewanella colwelliana]OEG74405.1 hypothetical protein BEL05_06065 [Shewanella colwelliana]